MSGRVSAPPDGGRDTHTCIHTRTLLPVLDTLLPVLDVRRLRARSSGRRSRITITNDKGRLSRDDIEQVRVLCCVCVCVCLCVSVLSLYGLHVCTSVPQALHIPASAPRVSHARALACVRLWV